MTFTLNSKLVEVVSEGVEGSFLFYRGNGDIVSDLPYWAEGVVAVNVQEHTNYWATALPSELVGAKLAATRVDIRDLNLLVVDPQSVQSRDLQLMEQPADTAYRMSEVAKLLELDLSAVDAADSVAAIFGGEAIAERELDTSYLDNPGTDEPTLAQAEATGFGAIVPAETKEVASGS